MQLSDRNSSQNSLLSSMKVFQHNFSTQINTLFALFLLCAGLGFLSPSFLTASNLISILLQATLVMILAVAETFIIISGGIDLSVGSVVALSSAVMGEIVVHQGVNPFAGIIIAFGIGTAAGFIHGLLITKLDMAPFIVTLGTMTVWRGVALLFVKGQVIYSLPEQLNWLGSAEIGIIPVAVIASILIYFIAWFVLSRTKLGVYTYAIGGNQHAARLSGINIDRTKIAIYTIGGFLCAVAGLVVVGRTGSTNASVAMGYELDAIAAVAIGGTSMAGGEGNIWGTLIGAVIMQVIRNGMNLLGADPYLQMVVLGVVIVAAVAVDCLRRKGKGR